MPYLGVHFYFNADCAICQIHYPGEEACVTAWAHEVQPTIAKHLIRGTSSKASENPDERRTSCSRRQGTLGIQLVMNHLPLRDGAWPLQWQK